MKNIIEVLSKLSQLKGQVPSLDSPTPPSYRKIISDYLENLEQDDDDEGHLYGGASSLGRRAAVRGYARPVVY